MPSTTATPEKTLVEIVYATEITGIPAPRDNNKNMTIMIHVDHPNKKGIFSCADPEHVGGHKNRKVFFIADDDCTLHFGNPAVLGVAEMPLHKNRREQLTVDDNTNGEGTDYWISVKRATAPEETEMMGHQQQALSPPRIEVP